MTRAITASELESTDHLTAAQAAALLRVHPESLRRARRRVKVAPDYELAGRLLGDGAPYPEVARTIGITTSRLRRRLPGYSASAEHRSIMASILATHALRRLHEEIGSSR